MNDLSPAAQTAMTILVPAVGFAAWLFRMEARISVLEKMQEEMGDDVRYIRERVDRAVNGHGHHK